MAWFPCDIGGGGGDTPATKSVSYLKWQILKTRGVPSGGSIQVAEFYLYQNADKYSWANGVSISCDMQGVSGEGIGNLIDGNTSTKFNTNDWGSVQTNECNITINLGETIVLDSHSTYAFCTPNDEISRDPVSWKLYGSEDGSTWELLDERNDAVVPTNRYTETISFPMTSLSGTDYTCVRGQFTSASTQHGIVDVNVGFKPDLVMVRMKLSNAGADTTSFWWVDESWAETKAIWELEPAEAGVVYVVDLDRQSGETGIQAINNDGFSFMSNGGNTQGCTCDYVAVKFKPSDIEFKNYAHLDGKGGINLPFAGKDTGEIDITFYEEEYVAGKYVFAHPASTALYINNNQFQLGYQGYNFSNVGSYSTGEHTAIIDRYSDNKLVFDNVEYRTFVESSSANNPIMFTANTDNMMTGNGWVGYIKSFKVYDRNHTILCELKPAEFNGVACLYDIINRKFYYAEGLTVMDAIPTN